MPASTSYAGGKLTAEYMLPQGLKSGDEAMVYGVFSQAERGQSEKGLADTLEAAGLKVDRLEISQEVNSDASLAVPSAHRLRPGASRTSRRSARSTAASPACSPRCSRRPARSRARSSSAASTSAPATIDGLKSGYVSATLDQLLYLQGFMPVLQCVLTTKYKMPGLSLNTGAGAVTPKTIDELVELIDAGIR